MKILFIYPDLNIDVNWNGGYYEGIASLSAILKSKGHHVELMHVYNQTISKNIIEKVATGFDLVGFSCTTPMFPFVQYWSKNIKNKFSNIPLLCGGSHATLSPQETLKKSAIDYVCVVEGEFFILEILDYLRGLGKKEDIKGLAFRKGKNEIVINKLRLPINPLDDLPLPDRDIFDLQQRNSTTGVLAVGRGCPFKCAYCSNNRKNEMYDNKYLRIRKPGTVIRENKEKIHHPFPGI